MRRIGWDGTVRGRRSGGPGRVAALAGVMVLMGCDVLGTAAPDAGDLMDGPLPGMTQEEMKAFVRGDEVFGRAFSAAEGLGPIFNDVSCAACHSGDGRGRPENGLIRFSVGEDLVPHLGGPQVQDRAIAGAVPEFLPEGVESSFRLPPPVFGVGLIEAIPVETILALADPSDADGDGISGRPNMVVPADFVPVSEPGGFIEDEEFPEGVPQLGRFGRKAQVSSLLLQVAKAYHEDMGVTNDFLPVENVNRQGGHTIAADDVPDPELSEGDLRAVLAYIRLLAAPEPGAMTARRSEGAALFDATGCASCHVPELRTGQNASAALSDRPVRLYSDLLLHDMGEGLADGRPDGEADGREWKTAPLWGLRVMRDFLNGDAFLLHDGRARSVEEAILLHGGEAQAARDAFAGLSAGERAALLDFVESR